MQEINFNKIKCIIWDLDETLWNNKLEQTQELNLSKKAIELIKTSTEYGVINSICSYNLEEDALKALDRFSIRNYFVFLSINYLPKGERIRALIRAMNLTADSVLFIDDEIQNLKEAEYYNHGIFVSTPYIIDEYLRYFRETTLPKKNRLNDYRILEKKNSEKKLTKLSNEDFLKYCNIMVNIKKVTSFFDLSSYEKARILELSLRTNQLNFTKNRFKEDDLQKYIGCGDDFGIISVFDCFGDYGICGYYILTKSKLIDFVFSCRIMNMGVEQYVYKNLGRPEISIKGTVASSLTSECDWINDFSQKSNNCIANTTKKTELKILFKGSCDFKRMRIFLPENVEYEVQYELDGKTIVYQTGIAAMAMTCKYPIEKILEYTRKIPFYSDLYYKTDLFYKEYDIVFLSLISLGNLGVYKYKTDDFFLAMGLPEKPMYLLENEADYSTHGKYANGFINERVNFDFLRDNYDYINDNYVDKYLIEQLTSITQAINAKKIFLLLGNEEKYHTDKDKTRAGIFFTNTNKIICEALANKKLDSKKIGIINISDVIRDESDVVNHFNHFTSSVYFRLSQLISKEIERCRE